MEKLSVLLFGLLFYIVSYAQSTKSRVLTVDDLKSQYALAVEIGDYGIAKADLLQLLAIYPQDTTLLYNLLWTYWETKDYAPVYNLSKKYLETYRSNFTLLDYSSRACQSLGKYSEAFVFYEKLYMITTDIYYQYHAANMEYTLGRYNECMNRINQTLAMQSANSDKKILITFDLSEGRIQVVDIFAALYNLKGVLYSQDKKYDDARISYKEALKIAPDFELARKNLELLPQ